MKESIEALPAVKQLCPKMKESIESLPAVKQLCHKMEESIEALPAVQQLCPKMEESIEALPAVQQVTLKPGEEKIISYCDVLSDSDLEDLKNVVDDDDDDDEEEEDEEEEDEDVRISRSQHEFSCKEWERMLKFIKIPHYYIELIMEANDVVLPENSEKLEFPIRAVFPETVLLMNEALVLEAAFRLGMKHSTEWTLESDVDELEAEINRARTTPFSVHRKHFSHSPNISKGDAISALSAA
ncbi:uncharacterized protein LOC108155055 [Drosophila miranda]|uniref:uncharacterized protein LOC108155055 n=1 Tax=Drosophila miranda TaxID=7229 RepID=UPI0007E5F29D|nr:uncharacterized protein LOC108155055 [Drosophila miranda]